MEEKNKGSNLVVIILTAVITVILTLGVVYFAFLRKPEEPANNGGNNTSQTATNKKLYHIETGEKFTLYGTEYNGNNKKLVERNKSISFDYPVIDIDNSKVKAINKEIYDSYQDDYNTNMRSEYNAEYNCVAIKKDGKYYGFTHIYYGMYKIFENDDYLSIVTIHDTYTECAGSGATYKGYVINKKTKEVMTNTELVNMFNASETLIINKYNEGSAIFDYDKAQTIDDVEIFIYEKNLAIVTPGNGDNLLKYNNGQFEEVY